MSLWNSVWLLYAADSTQSQRKEVHFSSKSLGPLSLTCRGPLDRKPSLHGRYVTAQTVAVNQLQSLGEDERMVALGPSDCAHRSERLCFLFVAFSTASIEMCCKPLPTKRLTIADVAQNRPILQQFKQIRSLQRRCEISHGRGENGGSLHRRIPDWFHGLSAHLTFLFCSTVGFVCMVC